MEASAQQDEQFMMWIMSRTAELDWEYDIMTGQRIKLKPGWEKAQMEYDRIAGLRAKLEKGLKDYLTYI